MWRPCVRPCVRKQSRTVAELLLVRTAVRYSRTRTVDPRPPAYEYEYRYSSLPMLPAAAPPAPTLHVTPGYSYVTSTRTILQTLFVQG